MLKQEVYEALADTFGVSVGLARIIDFHDREEPVYKEDKALNDELDINYIITDSIERKRYRKLQRELYRLNKKGYSPKIKEVTIYKRAWKEATNTNDSKKGDRKQSSKI